EALDSGRQMEKVEPVSHRMRREEVVERLNEDDRKARTEWRQGGARQRVVDDARRLDGCAKSQVVEGEGGARAGEREAHTLTRPSRRTAPQNRKRRKAGRRESWVAAAAGVGVGAGKGARAMALCG